MNKSSAQDINKKTMESIALNITDIPSFWRLAGKVVVSQPAFDTAKVMPKEGSIHKDEKSICYCNN